MTLREPPPWWVAVGGRAHGPYRLERVESFVREGRLTAESLVARDAEGPYAAAGTEIELSDLFRSVRREPAPTGVPPTRSPAGHVRPLLVVAELSSTPIERFEAALRARGDVIRAMDGAWLVSVSVGPADLRNALSRGLGASERLMVAEVVVGGVAWFGLDGGVDRAARQTWLAREPR